MHIIFTFLAVVTLLGCVVAHIIILIDAFKDEVWKGFVGLFCSLYLLYYAFIEFDHDKKWLIVGLWLGGGTLGAIFRMLAH